MKVNTLYVRVLAACMMMITWSCSNHGEQHINAYVIDNSKPGIEEIFFQQKANKTDTLLYVKYYIDNDSCHVSTAKNLGIGMAFKKQYGGDRSRSFNITYVGIEKPENNAGIFKIKTNGGFRLASYRNETPGAKRLDDGVQIIFDRDDFIYLGELAEERRLEIMKQLFSGEFKKVTGNNDCIQYRLVISHKDRAEVSESNICF